MFLVVDVKTTEADVIACYVSLFLADVIANVFVVDVMTTYNIEADVIACYISLLLADVIANICGRCYVHIIQHEKMLFWLMLLPCISVVDVITTEADVIACYISFYYWLMLLPIYVADVIATFFWYNVVADVIAKWQMEWPL